MHVGGALRLLLVLLLFGCYGHVWVVLHVLAYMHDAGLMSGLTYKRCKSAVHMYGLVPIVLGLYVLAIYMLYAYVGNPVLYAHLKIMSGIVAFGFHAFYVLCEAYVAAIDYGYNRALMRIRVEDEEAV
jgi:hypothetical protein